MVWVACLPPCQRESWYWGGRFGAGAVLSWYLEKVVSFHLQILQEVMLDLHVCACVFEKLHKEREQNKSLQGMCQWNLSILFCTPADWY